MPTTTPVRVAIVGGGLTGAAVGRALRRALPAESVVVWEGLAQLGGRMMTERTTVLGGATGLADSGAQYVTVTDDADVAEAHKPLYDSLAAAGVLVPMRGRIEGGRAADGGGTNYVAPQGVASIVERVFSMSSLSPCCSRRATALRHVAARGEEARSRWELTSADGRCEQFDGVVVACPIPDMLALIDTGEGGAWLDGASGVGRAELTGVQYSSRYALTLFYPASAAAVFAAHIDWAARYVGKADDDAIVYLAHDSAKRGGEDGGAVSLVVHTSVPYGIRALKAAEPEESVLADLRARVGKLLPWLPEPESLVLRPWRVSQVRYPMALPVGAACLPLRPPAGGHAAPPLVLAGDAFSPLGSRFDGCVQSGESAAAAVLAALVGT